jgi:hypothetical protein
MTNIILVFMLILAEVFTPGANVDEMLEKALQAELGDKVKNVSVETHINKGSLLTKGKIAAIDLTLDKLWVKPVLIDEAYFNITDVRLDTGNVLTGKAKKCVRSVGDIKFRFTFRPDDLARALELSSDNIINPKVRTEQSVVIISGKYAFGILKPSFEVEGYLTFEGGSRIYYRVQKVRLAGLGMPGRIEKLLENEMNPLFDLEKFHEKRKKEFEKNEKIVGRELRLKIGHIIVSDGKIVTTGSI